MSKVLLNDTRVCLEHLLRGPLRAELEAIPPAGGYLAVLDGTLSSIQALPPALLAGAPNAEALEEADIRHDGFGLALFYLAKAVLALPDATGEQKEAAKFILEHVVASRRELRAAYATQGARSAERRPVVDGGRAVLERITLFATNAYGLATSFLDAGALFTTLLSGRAEAQSGRSPAGLLRVKAIGQLNTLRQIIADAHAADPTRAVKADERFFAFYDLLTDMRDRGSKEPTPEPPPIPPPAA